MYIFSLCQIIFVSLIQTDLVIKTAYSLYSIVNNIVSGFNITGHQHIFISNYFLGQYFV